MEARAQDNAEGIRHPFRGPQEHSLSSVGANERELGEEAYGFDSFIFPMTA
jgi:hypothetical protein